MQTTAQILATTVDAVRVAVVKVLVADPSAISDNVRQQAVEVIGHYAGPEYRLAELEADLVHLRHVSMVEGVGPALENLTETGKVTMLRGCLYVVSADGVISPAAHGAAAEVGLALGLVPVVVRRSMQAFLDEQTPIVDLT